MSLSDDVLHVLVPQSAQNTKEELSLWQPSRELFLRGKVFHKQLIFESVCIKILDRNLLISWDLHTIDLVLFKALLGFTQDVSHEADLSAVH